MVITVIQRYGVLNECAIAVGFWVSPQRIQRSTQVATQLGYYTEFHGGGTEFHRVFWNFEIVKDSLHAQNDNYIWVIRYRSPPNPLKGERHPAKTLFFNRYVKTDIVLVLLFMMDQPRRGGSMVERMFGIKKLSPGRGDRFFLRGLPQRTRRGIEKPPLP